LSLGRGGPQPWSLGGASTQPYPYHFLVATLVAAYPACEVTLSVLRRIVRGKPVGSADKNHLHHVLRNLGLSSPSICALAAGFSLLCGGGALMSLLGRPGAATALLLSAAASAAVGLPSLGFLSAFHPRRLKNSRPHFRIANHFIAMQKAKLSLALYLNEVLTLVNQTCVEFGVERYAITLSGAAQKKGPWSYRWEKPAELARDHLAFLDHHEPGGHKGFTDKAALPQGKGSASWTFEPRAVEEDIDVEYYVLVSQFMGLALSRAQALCAAFGEEQLASRVIEGGATVNSSLLKRRTAIKRLDWLAPGGAF
jgi:hypothetical protein